MPLQRVAASARCERRSRLSSSYEMGDRYADCIGRFAFGRRIRQQRHGCRRIRIAPSSIFPSHAHHLGPQTAFHALPSVQLGYIAALCAAAGHDVVYTEGEAAEGDVAIVLTSLVDFRRECAWAAGTARAWSQGRICRTCRIQTPRTLRSAAATSSFLANPNTRFRDWRLATSSRDAYQPADSGLNQASVSAMGSASAAAGAACLFHSPVGQPAAPFRCSPAAAAPSSARTVRIESLRLIAIARPRTSSTSSSLSAA